jgi:allophanate hydrolase
LNSTDSLLSGLTFVGTIPNCQGRGAGTLLLQWGLSRAEKERLPVYLESTLSASSLYRKHGFVVMDGLALPLPSNTGSNVQQFYQEICMLRTWDTDDDDLGTSYWDSSLNITSLVMDYNAGIRPQQVVEAIYERIDAYKQQQSSVWIHLQPIGDVLAAAHAIQTTWPDSESRPPLWGVPFSVTDSIDVAGIPTTVGCPALAFVPSVSAPVYQHCIDNGALFIGKTNMEQLAPGMTGCRSPYGTLHSTFSSSHIVGGSSSGSAVTVSQQLVAFSLGSDTAGSIRLPALYNGVVGFKPTKGTVSARGIYPACLHQDCVSFLASTAEDAEIIWQVCRKYNKDDHFSKSLRLLQINPDATTPSRFRVGIPPEEVLLQCSTVYRRKFKEVVDTLRAENHSVFTLGWEPFAMANDLLYKGSFVLERLTILPEGWFEKNKQLLHPVTRQVSEEALSRNSSAVDLFRHKQAEYKRIVENILNLEYDPVTGEITLTTMIVPTAPFHPTIEDVERDPIGIDGRLGTFAHFANVLDLAAVAVPGGTYDLHGQETSGQTTTLPFGVTVLAGCGLDKELLAIAKVLEEPLRDLVDE